MGLQGFLLASFTSKASLPQPKPLAFLATEAEGEGHLFMSAMVIC